MALLGSLLGGLALAAVAVEGVLGVAFALVGTAVVPLLALVAVRLAVALTGPVAARVVDPEHLRTA